MIVNRKEKFVPMACTALSGVPIKSDPARAAQVEGWIMLYKPCKMLRRPWRIRRMRAICERRDIVKVGEVVDF